MGYTPHTTVELSIIHRTLL